MLALHTYSNVETLPRGLDTDPAHINPGGPVPLDFNDQSWSGGTTLNISGDPYAAGLSKRSFSPQADLLLSATKITKSFQIRPSQMCAILSQANESDLMIVDPSGNLYNGSLRKNNQTGGTWETVDSGGKWVSTGFVPGHFAPDAWTAVTVVYGVNWTEKIIALMSIEDGTTNFIISKPVWNPAIANSGWQATLIDDQEQETIGAVAGAYTRDVRDITITLQ